MTTYQKINLENLINRYNRVSYKEHDMMLKYKKEGNVWKAKHAKFCSDLAYVYMDGVIETLRLLGYTIKWEHGDSGRFVCINED